MSPQAVLDTVSASERFLRQHARQGVHVTVDYELLNMRVCLQQSCLAAGLGCTHQSSFVWEHITSAII